MNRKEARRSLSRSKDGFTLIEIILVIALLMLLAGVAVVNVGGLFTSEAEKLTRLKVTQSLEAPLFQFKVDTGSYPTTEQGIIALLKKPAGDRGKWKGPYVKDEESLHDAWGSVLQYRYPSSRKPGGYELYSLGEDKTESEDDIRNWE